MNGVKAVLTSELDTDQKRQVYQLSDGSKARAEIVKLTLASAGAISGYWKKWANLGLGEKLPVMGGGDRFVRAFDLEDFGVSVPDNLISNKNDNKAKPKDEKAENMSTN